MKETQTPGSKSVRYLPIGTFLFIPLLLFGIAANLWLNSQGAWGLIVPGVAAFVALPSIWLSHGGAHCLEGEKACGSAVFAAGGTGGRTLLSVNTATVFPVELSITSIVGTSVQ